MRVRASATESTNLGLEQRRLPLSTQDHQPQRLKPSKCNILESSAYTVCYSELRKAPLWAAYRVFEKNPLPDTNTRPSRFKVDDRTEAKVTHDDYTNTGYDRGHMAPFAAIDKLYGMEAGRETFLMSNVAPQLGGLNSGLWRTLEQRHLDSTKALGEVWLIVGPIYDNHPEYLDDGVEIPDAFFELSLERRHAGGRLDDLQLSTGWRERSFP